MKSQLAVPRKKSDFLQKFVIVFCLANSERIEFNVSPDTAVVISEVTFG